MMQKTGLNPMDFDPGSNVDSSHENQGNPRLRSMTTMQARTLCRSELSNDPAAMEMYKRWTEDFEDGLRLAQRVGYEKKER
jgi:hypothetical protein